jgi:hypothetical protein
MAPAMLCKLTASWAVDGPGITWAAELLCGSSDSRFLLGGLGPAPPGPLHDQGVVDTSCDAQPGRGSRLRHAQFVFVEPEEDARDFGQQVAAVAGDLL